MLNNISSQNIKLVLRELSDTYKKYQYEKSAKLWHNSYLRNQRIIEVLDYLLKREQL